MKALYHPLFIGAVFLKYAIAYVLLGDFFAGLHDNLDSEIVYTVVKGQYFARGLDPQVFDVFLGGQVNWYYFDRIFSPLTLIYAALEPRLAYLLTELLGLVLAYGGMLMLLGRIAGPQKYNRFLAVVYALGLSYSGYGFGLHIAPFVLAFLVRAPARPLRGYGAMFLLGTLTSLVLHGLFFPIAALAFLWIFRQKSTIRHFILTIGSFGLGSVVASSTIIYAMLQKVVYHRTDWPLDGKVFDLGALSLKTLNDVLTLGPWYHAMYVPALLAVFILLAGAFSKRRGARRATALVAAFIAVASLLGSLGPYYSPYLPSIAGSIQYVRLGFFAGLFLLVLAATLLARPASRFPRALALVGASLYLVFALLQGAGVSLDNIKTAYNRAGQQRVVAAVKAHGLGAAFSDEWLGEEAIGWSVFKNTRGTFGANFQNETYACFSDYITKGRALTFGYDPMVAAYHGIPVLDGYHNLYPRAYKHAFLKVIEDQLPLSEKGPDYYNNWGNRVYSFVDSPTDIRINLPAARALGGRYVISRFAVESPELVEIAPECGAESGFRLYEILAD